MGAAVVTDFTPDTKIVSVPSRPELCALLARWKVELPCECQIWIGIRSDNAEPTTAGLYCVEAHDAIIKSYKAKLKASLESPTDRPLVDVVEELLNGAWDEYHDQLTSEMTG